MNLEYKKYISGETYENHKQYFKCIFPQGGRFCTFIGTVNDVQNHMGMVHLKFHRFVCSICNTRFIAKVEFEMHKSKKKCAASVHTDLDEKSFDQNAEVVLWRCYNVFIRQLLGAELDAERKKRALQRSREKNSCMTPCYNEEDESSSTSEVQIVPPPNRSYPTFPVSHIPMPTTPGFPGYNQLPNMNHPPPPVTPYRPPPNYSGAPANWNNQAGPSTSTQRESRPFFNANRRGRQGRSRTPNNQQEPEEPPTGTVSLKLTRPQDMRRRSVSRVRYSERNKSPMRQAETVEIVSTQRLQDSFQTESRGTAKVPNMRYSRNACLLLETPPITTRAPNSAAEKRREDVKKKLERNTYYQELQRKKAERRSSRSRSPRNSSPPQ